MQPATDLGLPSNALEVAVALTVTATVALALALVAGGVVNRLFQAVEQDAHRRSMVRGTVRLVRLVTFVIAVVVLAFPALDAAGVKLPVGLHSRDLGDWLAQTGVRILGLIVLAFALVRLLRLLIARAAQDLATGTDLLAIERRKRALTVANLASRALSGLIWATATLMVLRELEVDITPVLTGAGILGLAVGFGAQTLVRDFISGFFLILEDQVRVGDVASVNGTGGLVEQINLRTIVLRDEQGTVHVFPNGEIKTLSNLTKDFAYYVIKLGIDYAEDTDRVVDSVRATAAELQRDPVFGPKMLEPLEVIGVDDFGDSTVALKVRVKTAPLQQWAVGRELRRRIKKAFDAQGIRLPSPQLEVTLRQGDQPPSAHS